MDDESGEEDSSNYAQYVQNKRADGCAIEYYQRE